VYGVSKSSVRCQREIQTKNGSARPNFVNFTNEKQSLETEKNITGSKNWSMTSLLVKHRQFSM